MNLYGPPGTGKTMAAHAITSALEKQMICVDYAEIESKYVGETSKNLSRLFQTAKEQDAVIFFDEADALLSKRVTNMTSATDVSVNQTRSVLLNLLNQYQGVILFATNFIQNFDAAFLRRIKYHIPFHLPDEAMRERLWRMYIPEKCPAGRTAGTWPGNSPVSAEATLQTLCSLRRWARPGTARRLFHSAGLRRPFSAAWR